MSDRTLRRTLRERSKRLDSWRTNSLNMDDRGQAAADPWGAMIILIGSVIAGSIVWAELGVASVLPILVLAGLIWAANAVAPRYFG